MTKHLENELLNGNRENYRLTRNSFNCGMIIFALSMIFVLGKAVGLVLIVSHFAPGLFYAIILWDFSIRPLKLKTFVFIGISVGLHLYNCKIATGFSFLGSDPLLIVPIASTLGSTLLFLAYYLLVNRNIKFLKGAILCFIMGVFSSLLPIIGGKIQNLCKNGDVGDIINYGFYLLIIPLWMTLFSLIIQKMEMATANNIGFADSGASH